MNDCVHIPLFIYFELLPLTRVGIRMGWRLSDCMKECNNTGALVKYDVNYYDDYRIYKSNKKWNEYACVRVFGML